MNSELIVINDNLIDKHLSIINDCRNRVKTATVE